MMFTNTEVITKELGSEESQMSSLDSLEKDEAVLFMKHFNAKVVHSITERAKCRAYS